MRVSVYSTGSPDYLIDIVADGLIRILGRENVHVRYNRTTSPSTVHDHLFKGFGGHNKFAFEEADVLVASVRCDINVVAAWRRSAGRDTVGVIDGEDEGHIKSDFLNIARTYFKREYLEGRSYPKKVEPLPMGAIPEELPPVSDRTTPIVFHGNLTSPIRMDIWAELGRLGHGSQAGIVSKHDYNRELSRSLIGIAARGIGWDTYRYWETPYFGCALLAQRIRIVVPSNFVDGKEAVFFDDMNGFRAALSALSSDPSRARAIGEVGRLACLERHLSTHRASTVLSSVSR